MQRRDAVLRWLGAVGITAAPLGLFVIPGLLYPVPVETAREQFAGIAEGRGGGFTGQLIQLAGVVCLGLAAVGIGAYVIARRRGRVLGAVGLIVGVVASIALLVVMGFELATMTLLTSAADVGAAVEIVVELSASPAFGIPLLIGLVGFFLTLPLLALALWRGRVVPLVVPLLFALPIVSGFVPLPFDATVVSGVLLLVPCVWMSVQLIRGTPVASAAPIAAAEAAG